MTVIVGTPPAEREDTLVTVREAGAKKGVRFVGDVTASLSAAPDINGGVVVPFWALVADVLAAYNSATRAASAEISCSDCTVIW